MSRSLADWQCTCGGATQVYIRQTLVEGKRKSQPHGMGEQCRKCGFIWGVKE